jgi:protein-disulfide isomerase
MPEGDSHPSEGRWAYLLIGLAIGAIIGGLVGVFVGRPWLASTVAQPATVTTAAAPTAAQGEQGDAETTSTPVTMDLVVSGPRHFQGAPDAPVTIVEYGDFL